MKKLILLAIIIALISACESAIVQPPENSSFKVTTIKSIVANFYFIQTDDGYILVDTGLSNGERKLDKAFSATGIDPDNVSLIIITHAHKDHSGSVAYAKEITGGNVLCHEYAASFIREGESSRDNAKTPEGELVNAIMPNQGVEPDIVITTEFDLSEYGIDGIIIPTPGHSQGSITVILDNGEVILGDLVGEENGHMKLLTYEDKDVLIQSLETIASYDVSRIYMSHGESIGYIDNEIFQESIESLK